MTKITDFFVANTSSADIEHFTQPSIVQAQGDIAMLESTTFGSPIVEIRYRMSQYQIDQENWVKGEGGIRFCILKDADQLRILPPGKGNSNWGDHAFQLLMDADPSNDALATELMQESWLQLTYERTVGVDPLKSRPFLVLAEDLENLPEDQRKLAAASLTQSSNPAATAFLEAHSQHGPDEIQLQVNRALAARYRESYDERAIPFARRATEIAGSDQLTPTLIVLEKLDAAFASANATYANRTQLKDKHFLLARIEFLRGNFEEGAKHARRYENPFAFFSGSGVPGRLANSYAWASLFHPSPPEDAIDVAEREMQVAPSSNLAHTFATRLAVKGRLADARDNLRYAVMMRPLNQYQTDDDLVLGKIAEQLGLIDIARQYYRRCLAKPLPSTSDSDDLARKWLADLEQESGSTAEPSLGK